jgi:hypothetical protein
MGTALFKLADSNTDNVSCQRCSRHSSHGLINHVVLALVYFLTSNARFFNIRYALFCLVVHYWSVRRGTEVSSAVRSKWFDFVQSPKNN